VSSEQEPELSGIYAGSLDSKEYHLVVRAIVGPAFETKGTILYIRDGVVVAQPFDERKLAVSGEPVALPDHVGSSPITGSAWFSVSAEENMVYFSAPPGGLVALSWFDRDGRRGETLDTGDITGFALSPDGTRAAASIYNPDGQNADLWNYDLSRGTKTRLTSGPETKQWPVWQPDGQFVLFTSGLLGSGSHIYRTRSDGSGRVETVLNSNGASEAAGSFCRDGRYLAYVQIPKGSTTLSNWILPLTGDRKPFALVQSQFSNSQPVFSPDCKWVAYVSTATGRAEVYLTRFPDSTRIYQVSTQGGNMPRWQADGKELFYYSDSHSSIMAVNVEEKVDETSLGTPRTLFHLGIPVRFFTFDVTPDGRRFLIVTSNQLPGPVPLTLVTNWNAELKKQ
jgi:eukaryotic-like serine/threonine-protein kinase